MLLRLKIQAIINIKLRIIIEKLILIHTLTNAIFVTGCKSKRCKTRRSGRFKLGQKEKEAVVLKGGQAHRGEHCQVMMK